MHRAADGVDNRGDIFALALKRVVINMPLQAASSPVNCQTQNCCSSAAKTGVHAK